MLNRVILMGRITADPELKNNKHRRKRYKLQHCS